MRHHFSICNITFVLFPHHEHAYCFCSIWLPYYELLPKNGKCMPLPFMRVDFKNDARVSYGCSNQQFLSSNFLPNSLSCLIICRTFVVGKLFIPGDNLASRRPAYSKKTLPIASVKFLILDFMEVRLPYTYV